MLHLNFSCPFPLENYSILFYLQKFQFLFPPSINTLFSEKIFCFLPSVDPKTTSIFIYSFMLSLGGHTLFSFLFSLIFSPHTIQREYILFLVTTNIRSLDQRAEAPMFKNTINERKGRKSAVFNLGSST